MNMERSWGFHAAGDNQRLGKTPWIGDRHGDRLLTRLKQLWGVLVEGNRLWQLRAIDDRLRDRSGFSRPLSLRIAVNGDVEWGRAMSFRRRR